ncbi:DUF2793 domain-containing protein [Sphingobium yanoikuyae]|uniref:DUF2793 domain-containing protein n=1 Tax=Sphingobium yanoikuyae TaxID=13690 RepID=A0A6M4G2P5_SPHYA|nr:DUF2793 domain-containing protein [Sphingobium yanoikuyae]QJR01488.1 DUF2793 domain-containing protein [Sphingobium yanoikuyae]
MMNETSDRWALPLLHAGQAQKEIMHNEALARIDMLLHGVAESADLAVPPTAPVAGQCWIVAAGASGAWAGRQEHVAGWTEGGWRFVAPRAGLRLAVTDRGHAMVHDGTAWRDDAVRSEGFYVAGQQIVGARQPAITGPTGGTTVDSESRGAIAAILAALQAHGLISM